MADPAFSAVSSERQNIWNVCEFLYIAAVHQKSPQSCRQRRRQFI